MFEMKHRRVRVTRTRELPYVVVPCVGVRVGDVLHLHHTERGLQHTWRWARCRNAQRPSAKEVEVRMLVREGGQQEYNRCRLGRSMKTACG
jgi:hypothetical protein